MKRCFLVTVLFMFTIGLSFSANQADAKGQDVELGLVYLGKAVDETGESLEDVKSAALDLNNEYVAYAMEVEVYLAGDVEVEKIEDLEGNDITEKISELAESEGAEDIDEFIELDEVSDETENVVEMLE